MSARRCIPTTSVPRSRARRCGGLACSVREGDATAGIEQTNFDTYTPLRLSQLQEVAISVIANGEKATGVGEPAVTVVAPALGNAIFNARGARIRSLPITADAIKAAMKDLKPRTRERPS
jgi:hypothetical protein